MAAGAPHLGFGEACAALAAVPRAESQRKRVASAVGVPCAGRASRGGQPRLPSFSLWCFSRRAASPRRGQKPRLGPPAGGI